MAASISMCPMGIKPATKFMVKQEAMTLPELLVHC